MNKLLTATLDVKNKLCKESRGRGTRYILAWGGAAWPLNTLTLFKTKIVQFLIPCLRHAFSPKYTLFKKFAKKRYPV